MSTLMFTSTFLELDWQGPRRKFMRRRLKRRGRIPLAPFATQARPGTPEKVAILAQRARMKVALWHPKDASLG